MGGFSTAGGASPADVWNYAKRRTNVTTLAGPNAGNPNVIYRGKAGLIGNYSRLKAVLSGPGYGAVVWGGAGDKLPSAIETILETNFSTANLKDYNDDTYSKPVTDLAGSGTRDHVKYDFGTIASRFVFATLYSYALAYKVRVLISNDDVTYTTLLEVSGGKAAVAKLASFRYIKLQSYNSDAYSASADYFRFYSVEVYEPVSLPISYSYAPASHEEKILTVLYDASNVIAYCVWREDDLP